MIEYKDVPKEYDFCSEFDTWILAFVQIRIAGLPQIVDFSFMNILWSFLTKKLPSIISNVIQMNF